MSLEDVSLKSWEGASRIIFASSPLL